MRIVIGITGASGSIYGIRLIEVLKAAGCEIHAVVSESGWQVLEYECVINKEMLKMKVDYLHDVNNIGASIASGSFRTDAMVIVPCSMRTLGGIANGIADSLLTRAADVMLKEGRPLLLVPRETPLNAIHLENMLKLARIGVKIIPASPGFYHRPQNLESIVDMMVGKICDMLKIEHTLFERWQGN
ncbi:UbiX family flavin prenyltransferase [Dendrosporobacter sp. 1207_IL3150]|uniref:UbiX family flavin prenyltransferase n=1 Tax=Dendrosporobacter sp. 1207_IL3150 TaxID=3084054 RepID=UPI002FD980A8